MYGDIPEEMRALVEPVVDAHELELVDISISRNPGLVRITVDNKQGDGRVSVDACAEVSREVESHLDASSAIDEGYRLEVSSPGLDRILAREKDFRAACGREVKLQTRRPVEGRRRFRGTLTQFDAGVARVLVDGAEIEIAFSDVERANALYEFSRADFAKSASK